MKKNFPILKKHSVDVKAYLKKTEEAYINDAYHSLSIEGYQVSHELIEKVRSGRWNATNTWMHWSRQALIRILLPVASDKTVAERRRRGIFETARLLSQINK